jgi:uncharacterized protein (DUF1697 family)
MKRYAAFLRGVSPMNAKMPELKKAFEAVTFLREEPKAGVKLPPELDGARILRIKETEVFTAYVPSGRGPAFMTLIEKTFGKDVTTRTWDTVTKVAKLDTRS